MGWYQRRVHGDPSLKENLKGCRTDTTHSLVNRCNRRLLLWRQRMGLPLWPCLAGEGEAGRGGASSGGMLSSGGGDDDGVAAMGISPMNIPDTPQNTPSQSWASQASQHR